MLDVLDGEEILLGGHGVGEPSLDISRVGEDVEVLVMKVSGMLEKPVYKQIDGV